jgi:perosamine synthetase
MIPQQNPNAFLNMIPYGKHLITDSDIQAVLDCLRSDFLTQGPKIHEFESRFANKLGARHAVAVNNATAGLHLAMLVGGIGKGDRVITSPITFLASANCAAYVGAIPDFADVDPVTLTLDLGSLAKTWKPDTKAVVAVAYAGQSANMPAIAEFARARGALVIEDACHGTGGGFEHQGRPYQLGAHPWADITTFSFHPVKTMTTGEGGMLVTDNDEYAARARLLRSHGVERNQFQGLGAPAASFDDRGPWYYEMQALGYNYRLTDIQCALGLSQLSRLGQMIERRAEITRRYNEAFSGLPWLETPGLRNPLDEKLISWHLYTVRLRFEKLKKSRSHVMAELKDKGIGTQVLYIPVHLQPWYRATFGYGFGKCPVAEGIYPHLLSLPLYSGMDDDSVSQVITAIKSLATT